MPFLTIPFPAIDPIIVQIGPLAIRWYALAYVAGLVLAWWLMRRMAARAPVGPAGTVSAEAVDDFLVWATIGVVLGGRLGYVLFYQFQFYAHNPLSIFQVWRGGMSFHGGLLGVVVATILFCWKRGIPLMVFSDMIATVAPIGLFLGRLANFVNGELFGRPTDVPWAMVFPHGGPFPRHPSQLYEAALEGLLLFALLQLIWRVEPLRRRRGLTAGLFFLGYAAARAFAELFRQPDVQIGFLAGGSTMGQWLSLPMVLFGVFLVGRAVLAKQQQNG
ncbi:MAG: prolipoprotein diacylglyceryl transferase [Hyphomicrobiales bacterium]|nr:prolipoprotein diacylglyceryl transferase [Hyphomicrobiales bacterium]MCP5371948.1 prolipoprotein diacylglyceryl transferase [Hyphomicrobiales bacterium]